MKIVKRLSSSKTQWRNGLPGSIAQFRFQVSGVRL